MLFKKIRKELNNFKNDITTPASSHIDIEKIKDSLREEIRQEVYEEVMQESRFEIAAKEAKKNHYWQELVLDVPDWARDMQKQTHVLIGGTTGSGKSVALNTFIFSLLEKAPTEFRLVLIDPKGVELLDYKDLPHTSIHAVEPYEIDLAINVVAEEMDFRFDAMMQNGEKITSEPDMYLIIDEFVDIKMLCAKRTIQNLMRIASKGRAAKIHIILCTQRPTSDILDGTIKANFSTVLALRTRNAQESRNLIGIGGCENLPMYGYAFYDTPSDNRVRRVEIPMITPEDMQEVINFWMLQKR